MVLCMYFLNNSCRFGSRCNNEHIDIGSIVKTEVDVSLKGNQWPLSCFGPFKERNCIPSFIEDLSFEEIRMMYLEAKMQNNIPAHQMQLAQMINDAKTKMQCLTTMNRDILNTLVEIYNQQESSAKPTNAPLNTFASIGSGGSNAPASGIFGSGTSSNAFGSLFGSSAAIGGSNAGTAGTASTTGNIFAKPAQQPAAGNIFGMPQQPNPVFGGPAVMGGGLFGSVQQPQQPPAQNGASLFGGVTTATNPAAGGNLFASAATSAFGQPSGAGSGFGGANMFGNNAASSTPALGGFGTMAAAQPQQSSGLFNTVPFGSSAPATASFGSFGSSMQAAPSANAPSSQNLFLSTPAANPFGASLATMYSSMDNVTAEHLAAFKADQFQLGRIPTVPPPKELCH
ncbi:AGAP009989-PA [Anopheles gambiae str. PEST]|uniref:Nucleoporin NUP42 n=1 Tax=Anopheles gambiae TaxID=7165 RepID=Q7PM54_ANOGA|nr:AGAP009989-PA [Anopheles gambiae str. PEST]